MICFLTSSPMIPGTETLNPENGFTLELRRYVPENCRALFICSDPDLPDKTDFIAASMKRSLEGAGFRFRRFSILDGRNESRAANLVARADLIVLAGGHVPTQNRFFEKIGLRALLQGYDGILMGISAGTMNSAETVYAQPEEEGEAIDPDYQRFLPGLGLTKTMILPHLQMIREDELDGLRVFEDIAFPDSLGKTFYAIPDGSFLLIRDGREELRGEAYRIQDGVMTQVSGEGDVLPLPPQRDQNSAKTDDQAGPAPEKDQPERVILTNMCMIMDGDKVLVEEKVGEDAGGITFPGGHVEKGEPVVDSVIREMKEETGLTIRQPRLCGVKDWINEDGSRYVVFLFKTDQFSGELHSSLEGRVFWLEKDDVLRSNWIWHMDSLMRILADEAFSELFLDRADDWKPMLK